MADMGEIGGGVGIMAAIVTLWNIVTGRNDKRTELVAVEAVRKSGAFTVRAEQDQINLNLRHDVREIKETVKGIDEKIDAILLSGQIRIQGKEN